MASLNDWQYIARKMKMYGFSTKAILRSLDNIGYDIPKSTLLHCLALDTYTEGKYVPPGYHEFRDTAWYDDPPKRTDVLGMAEIITEVLEIDLAMSFLKTPGQSEVVSDDPDFCVISRGRNSLKGDFSDNGSDEIDGTTGVDTAESESLSPDSFSFWSGDKYKTGLQRYIDYERRSNKMESDLDGDGY